MSVQVERQGHVATITFARPPSNFADLALLQGLVAAFATTDADPDVRATVLASEGRVFCAGADLAHANPVAGARADGAERNPFYVAAAGLFAVRKPIVAAVQGAAVGAGLGLALVADFRVAGPEARFAANFVQLGFHPGFGISAVLPRVIGQQRAAMMCLTGRRIRAAEALDWQLADLVADDPLATARSLAAEIATGAPLAVLATRATLRAGLAELVIRQTDHELARQAELMATDDFAEGVRAVNERRPGRFTGR